MERTCSLHLEHHVSLVLHGIHSSLATVSTNPVTCGAIKLPIIIHQVLRVPLSTFRSSAWHFPLMVALANGLTEFRWLHQAMQLYYVSSNEWLSLGLMGGLEQQFKLVVKTTYKRPAKIKLLEDQFSHLLSGDINTDCLGLVWRLYGFRKLDMLPYFSVGDYAEINDALKKKPLLPTSMNRLVSFPQWLHTLLLWEHL